MFAPVTYHVPGIVTAADVTGDGLPDLVGAGSELSVAANRGDRRFHAIEVLTEAAGCLSASRPDALAVPSVSVVPLRA